MFLQLVLNSTAPEPSLALACALATLLASRVDIPISVAALLLLPRF